MSNLVRLITQNAVPAVIVKPFMKEWRVEHCDVLCDEAATLHEALLLAKNWSESLHAATIVIKFRSGRERVILLNLSQPH